MRTLSAAAPRQALPSGPSTSLTHTAHPPVHQPKQTSGPKQTPSAVEQSIRIPRDAERHSALHPAAHGGITHGSARPIRPLRGRAETRRAAHRPVKVIVAARNGFFTQLLAAHLTRSCRCRVGGQAASMPAALKQAAHRRADLVLVDARLAGVLTGGMSALGKLSSRVRRAAICVPAEAPQIASLLRCGFTSLLAEDSSLADLADVVTAAPPEQTLLSPSLACLVADWSTLRANERPLTPVQRLTPRQQTIWRAVSEGQTTKQIAHALGISIRTVEKHREGIRSGLNHKSALT
jgi:DNA-binding NarL/FixJ family response regulator